MAPLDSTRRDGTGLGTLQVAERELAACGLPAMIVWGREDDVFDQAIFAARFKRLLPNAGGPHLVTGGHFLQEDSGRETVEPNGVMRSCCARRPSESSMTSAIVSVLCSRSSAQKVPQLS
jgi:hypothetical protein